MDVHRARVKTSYDFLSIAAQNFGIHQEIMTMKVSRAMHVVIAMLLFTLCGAAQELPTDETAPLVLVRIIPMSGVEGRFDHMAVDNQNGRVFASVYGNDTVQVLDTQRGARIHSLEAGFIKPRWWSTFPIQTASWCPVKATAPARFLTLTPTN